MHRPPNHAFATPKCRGRFDDGSRRWWHCPFLIIGVFALGSLILGLASAIRGAGSPRANDQ